MPSADMASRFSVVSELASASRTGAAALATGRSAGSGVGASGKADCASSWPREQGMKRQETEKTPKRAIKRRRKVGFPYRDRGGERSSGDNVRFVRRSTLWQSCGQPSMLQDFTAVRRMQTTGLCLFEREDQSLWRSDQRPCSSRNFSTSSAAMQPEPAAVMAWR